MVPRNSIQLLNMDTTKFQVEREPDYGSSITGGQKLVRHCGNAFNNFEHSNNTYNFSANG